MLNDEIRTVEETYACAITTSDLRVQAEVRSPADAILAAGMSKSRLGSALLRLHSEFDSSALPKRPTSGQIEVIARANPKDVPTGKNDEHGLPIINSVPDFKGAETLAWGWYKDEVASLIVRLKSLAYVRSGVLAEANRAMIQAPENVVQQVIGWWLMQRCHVCEGRQEQVILGTGRLSGRACRQCHGSGKSPVPYGSEGRFLANVMDEAIQKARTDIRRKLWQHHKA